jgi:hypothetical protein
MSLFFVVFAAASSNNNNGLLVAAVVSSAPETLYACFDLVIIRAAGDFANNCRLLIE